MTTVLRENISAEDLNDLLRSARLLRQKAMDETPTPAGAAIGNLASRLQASVIRPLAMLLGESAALPASESKGIHVGTPDMGLWELTRRITVLCAAPARPRRS